MNDIQSVVKWGKKWIVNIYASKTKLLSFNKDIKLLNYFWLLLNSREFTHWGFLVWWPPLTRSRVIILNQLLCISLGNIVHSLVPDRFFFLSKSILHINKAFKEIRLPSLDFFSKAHTVCNGNLQVKQNLDGMFALWG